MSSEVKNKLPQRLAVATVAVISLFGAVSCVAGGSSAGSEQTTTAPKPDSTESTTTSTAEPDSDLVVVHISELEGDPEYTQYGDKYFTVRGGEENNEGVVRCLNVGLMVHPIILNGKRMDTASGEGEVLLKGNTSCDDDYLSNNEAAFALADYIKEISN